MILYTYVDNLPTVNSSSSELRIIRCVGDQLTYPVGPRPTNYLALVGHRRQLQPRPLKRCWAVSCMALRENGAHQVHPGELAGCVRRRAQRGQSKCGLLVAEAAATPGPYEEKMLTNIPPACRPDAAWMQARREVRAVSIGAQWKEKCPVLRVSIGKAAGVLRVSTPGRG